MYMWRVCLHNDGWLYLTARVAVGMGTALGIWVPRGHVVLPAPLSTSSSTQTFMDGEMPSLLNSCNSGFGFCFNRGVGVFTGAASLPARGIAWPACSHAAPRSEIVTVSARYCLGRDEDGDLVITDVRSGDVKTFTEMLGADTPVRGRAGPDTHARGHPQRIHVAQTPFATGHTVARHAITRHTVVLVFRVRSYTPNSLTQLH